MKAAYIYHDHKINDPKRINLHQADIIYVHWCDEHTTISQADEALKVATGIIAVKAASIGCEKRIYSW